MGQGVAAGPSPITCPVEFTRVQAREAGREGESTGPARRGVALKRRGRPTCARRAHARFARASRGLPGGLAQVCCSRPCLQEGAPRARSGWWSLGHPSPALMGPACMMPHPSPPHAHPPEACRRRAHRAAPRASSGTAQGRAQCPCRSALHLGCGAAPASARAGGGRSCGRAGQGAWKPELRAMRAHACL